MFNFWSKGNVLRDLISTQVFEKPTGGELKYFTEHFILLDVKVEDNFCLMSKLLNGFMSKPKF